MRIIKNCLTEMNITKKILIILIFILVLNFIVASVYYQIFYDESDILGWLTLAKNICLYILAIYLIKKNNIIGILILIYMTYGDLQLEYYVGGYYGIQSFLTGPQAMFSDITELLIFVLAIIDCIVVIFKKIKPNSSAFNTKPQHQTKIDLILAGISIGLIIFYWSFWTVLKFHIGLHGSLLNNDST